MQRASRFEEYSDGSGGQWLVPAEPAPICCDTLTEALHAWARLSYVDALNDLSEKFPPRDIPIRFSTEDRTIRRWQIDLEFSGREGPKLIDAFDPPPEPAPSMPEVAVGQTFTIESLPEQ